jgi:hypothetical protein
VGGPGGDPVEAAGQRAFAEAVRETLAMGFGDPPGVDLAAWAAHGRLTAAEAHALVRTGLAEIVEPCQKALFAGDPGPSSRPGGPPSRQAPG